VLLPYQQDWIADRAPVKIYEKGRRTGISWAEAADDVLDAAASREAGGCNVYYLGYEKEMTRGYIEDCAFFARTLKGLEPEIQEEIIRDEDKDILVFRIKFASGFEIQALSSSPRNLRSRQGKIVLDEAGFHDDLPGLLKAAFALLVWGGRVIVISTHNGEDNYFNELLGEVRAGRKPYSLHRTTFDDALAAGLYRRICLKREKDWTAEGEAAWRREIYDFYGEDAAEELDCIPSRGSGNFLIGAVVQQNMAAEIPVLRLALKNDFAQAAEAERQNFIREWCLAHLLPLLEKLEPNRPSWLGEDFGRSGDLSVFAPAQEAGNFHWRVPFLLELRNCPFKQQEQILFFICDRLPEFRGAALDARGNGQYLAEVAAQRYGDWRIEQVMLSQEFYRENMPKYKAALEDRQLDLPQDPDVLDDHRAIRMEKGVAHIPEQARRKGRDGGWRHGDSAVACFLLWRSISHLTSGPLPEAVFAPQDEFDARLNYEFMARIG